MHCTTPCAVECHQISPCSTVICGEQCTEVLGFKHPEILCVPANPPSQYYDTCCCRERENITRTSLSKWSCILFHDDKHEMDHECWLMNKYCFIYEAFVRPLALLYLIIYPILNHVLQYYCRVPPCAPKVANKDASLNYFWSLGQYKNLIKRRRAFHIM